MLRSLSQWRGECTEEQLADFDRQLALHCGTAVISAENLRKRYHGSYHRALINSKVLHEAVKTQDYIRGSSLWGSDIDAGKEFCSKLADHDGLMAVKQADMQYAKSIPRLLQRGIVFERKNQYHLSAEIVVEYRSKADGNSWMTLTSKASLPMLHQLVSDDAKQQMLKPTPIRNELVAWLLIHGAQSRQSDAVDQLDQKDWELLLVLQHHRITSFQELHQHFPEFEPVYKASYHYYSEHENVNLRKSLEAAIPSQLCKLARLGLIGITVQNGHETYASVTLCDEGRTLLKPYLKQVRQRIAKQLQNNWLAAPCDVEAPSPWSMDQQIWRLWITLHFLPVGVTQQEKLRKNELKRIGKLLGIEDVSLTEFLLMSMLHAELIKQQQSRLISSPVNWNTWRCKLREAIYEIVRGQNRHWKKQDETQVFSLLSKLPVSCWLRLNDVIGWLQLQASGNVLHAAWPELFSDYQNCALHHLNNTDGRIYLLPIFQAVMKQQNVSFPAPGWRGADQKAKVHGFISASGEIQLPPDCNHRILNKLAKFCTLTNVEQMITLQLDNKALQRMGSDKAALKKTRTLLESLHIPLPQAVTYLFDKQQAQKPIAVAAATSMVILLHEASAIHKLHKTGFSFFQPFKDKPELVVLDASADAHAFVQHCAAAGIMLDTLIKPVQWISGTASIKAWMDISMNRTDRWLDICYQKQRNSKPKQLIARIEYDRYGELEIKGTRKTTQGYALLKSTVSLQPKHVLRLRELDVSEVKDLGLDQLA